jgi:isopentenyl-diphosphate delta-isomerase
MVKKTTEQRKIEHLEVCLKKDVSFKKTTGLETVELPYNALPEISYNKIDTSTTFLEKKLSFPLIISSMTGGCTPATKINRDLAKLAQDKGIAFALGSVRALIENKKLYKTYYVRDVAPDALVLGNVGIGNLKQYSTEQIMEVMDSLKVDGFYVHLNAAQEVLQKEGDTDWTGVFERLGKLCRESKYPVLIKEVGNGISAEVAKKLDSLKISAIEIAGAGGTSWTKAEYLRTGKGAEFSEWGIPTLRSLLQVKTVTDKDIIASGGIRTGLDIAKCINLGTKLCGIALPFLKAQQKKRLGKYYDELYSGLKTAMFLTNSQNLNALSKR